MIRPITRSLLASVVLTIVVAVPASAQLAGLDTLETELIDPGAEPRQELRYRFEEGQSGTMGMEVGIAMSNLMDGAPVMDMEMLMSAEVDTLVSEVYDDGSARVEMVYTSYELALSEALAQAELDLVSDMFVGLEMWQVVDPMGTVLEVGLGDTDLPPELQQEMLDTTTATQPLPAEPVGLGARWVAQGSMDAEGIPMQLAVTSEVIELDDDSVVLGLTIAADAEFASSMFDELPDADVSVGRFFMDGGGEVSVDFDSIVPESDAEIELVLEMTVGGEGMAVDVAMDVLTSMLVFPVE
mgnify:FL=1